MKYDYWKNTSSLMMVTLVVIGLLAVIPLINLIYLGFKHLELGYSGDLSLTSLGQLGDFFGGHTAAFTGVLSLLVILFFTIHQARQQQEFFSQQRTDEAIRTSRSFFLEGIGLITQWDISAPGSDQCLRLLDYYCRISLSSTDRELLLILNTVITDQIRANLQGKNGSFKKTNFPYAYEALERIAELRKEDGLAMRDRRNSEKCPVR